MNETRYRFVFALLGLAFAAVVAGAVVLAPDGRPQRLPDAIDAISPEPEDIVLSQASLRIDMRPGYEIELYVDGVRIPRAEIAVVEETGLHTWAPSPGASIEQWRPGAHSVQLTWISTGAVPDVGEYRWTFGIR